MDVRGKYERLVPDVIPDGEESGRDELADVWRYADERQQVDNYIVQPKVN